jgi:predicted metal-dependent hydrolase
MKQDESTPGIGAPSEIVVNKLVRSRRKTVSLIIGEGAELVVRVPMRMSMKDIERVVREKGGWIRKNQELMRRRRAAAPERLYGEGEPFLWMGRNLRIAISPSEPHVRREDGLLLVPEAPAGKRRELVTRWYVGEARRLLTERVRIWSALMGLPCDRLTISKANKRWGSCNGHANLSFTARLVMAPAEVIDYVVVHELAHVAHKNHGAAFWELVAAQVPDYNLHRRWLAEHVHGMVI